MPTNKDLQLVDFLMLLIILIKFLINIYINGPLLAYKSLISNIDNIKITLKFISLFTNQVPEVRLYTKCSINVKDFPFDKQCCEVSFYSWAHTAKQMIIQQVLNKNVTNTTHLRFIFL